MQAFTKITGPMLVLEQENIDTDQIIPARFLTATSFAGIGEHAFVDWRHCLLRGLDRFDFLHQAEDAIQAYEENP